MLLGVERPTLQDESRPIHRVFLSEPTENDGRPSAKDNFSATVKIAKAVLPVLKEGQQLVYVGSEKAYVRLKDAIGTAKLAHVVAPPYMWLQDLIEFAETKNGLVGVMSAGDRSVAYTAIAIMQSVVPDTVELKVLKMHTGAMGSIGGNFELWPGEIGIIGTSDFSSLESLAAFSKQIFREGTQVVNLPTSWLYIGHVDEVVKLISYRPGDSCELQLLINSTERALSVLRDERNSPFLDELELGGGRISQIDSIARLCKMKRLPCRGLRNHQVFEAYTADPQMKASTTLLQAEFNEIKRLVTDVYSKRLPSCRLKWIEAPALYLAPIENSKLKSRAALPVFPSLTNGLLINGSYVVADPGNPTFRKQFARSMESVQVKVIYVPLGRELFRGKISDGHIHCMTQVLREPRGQ